IKEFYKARDKILKHFRTVFKLLQQSNRKNDAAWKAAEKLLIFRELSGFGLGYSAGSTNGAGIGPRKRAKLLNTAHEIVTIGQKDPELLEYMGILEDGIASDNIGDMICSILKE